MTSKFLIFLLFGFVATAMAASVGELEEDDLETVEVVESGEAQERGFFSNSKDQHRCTCSSGTKCGCCARTRIPVLNIKVQGCLNITMNPDEKTVDVALEGNGKVVLSKKVSTAAADRICDRLPGQLDSVKACLYTNTSELPDKSGIQMCGKIDLMKESKIIAKVQFACAQFKDNKLSLNDNGDVKAKELFSFKTGNIFKGVLNAMGLREPSNKA